MKAKNSKWRKEEVTNDIKKETNGEFLYREENCKPSNERTNRRSGGPTMPIVRYLRIVCVYMYVSIYV
jgi:hypothetical protein